MPHYPLPDAHAAPPAEERDGFKFRSGRLALDLPATLAFRLKPEPKDLLETPKDLGRWLVASGLSKQNPHPTPEDLKAARGLRESLYRLAQACLKGEAFPAKDRALVNRWAAAPPPAPQLGAQPGSGGLTRAQEVSTLLAAVARDGVELLGGPLAARVRKCARDGCALLFLDTSRSGRRRWCSMAACGNKAKVGAFRERLRAME